jgi:hypothetical protein
MEGKETKNFIKYYREGDPPPSPSRRSESHYLYTEGERGWRNNYNKYIWKAEILYEK